MSSFRIVAIYKDKWISNIPSTSVEHWRKLSHSGSVGDVPMHSTAAHRGLAGTDVRPGAREGFSEDMIRETPAPPVE